MTRVFLATRLVGWLLLLALVCLPNINAWSADKDNTIYTDLLQKGVPLSGGQIVKLEPPAMADGLNAAAQRKVITGLVPANRLQSFLAGGLNDYFELKITAIPAVGGGAGTGRKIDLYFIANGGLAAVANKNFMKQQIGGGNKETFINAGDLAARNIAIGNNPNVTERYAHVDFNLFNMVQIAATGHGMQTTGTGSELIAFIVDPRFANDPKFPNEWKSIVMDPSTGKKKFSDPNPYEGAGGYAKVTELVGPTKQVFIEYHLVFDEPQGWFNGKPVLTSKLPDKFRSDVRSFRRDLTAFAKQQQAAPPANPPAKAANPKDDQKADGAK